MNLAGIPLQTETSIALPPLAVVKLACRRGTRLLFKDLDLEIHAGTVVWVRGQNGRGKTSLLRLIAGLSTPDAGQVTWAGEPVRRAEGYCRQVVYVGHTNALKEDLSVSEALAFLLQIHGRPHDAALIDTSLEQMGLQKRRSALVRTLSQGQRRRVALTRLAVESTASTWVLDEPFDALDVDGIARLNTLLVAHVKRGGRVILTSHQAIDQGLLQPVQVDLDGYA